jgi:hypothetical protein
MSFGNSVKSAKIVKISFETNLCLVPPVVNGNSEGEPSNRAATLASHIGIVLGHGAEVQVGRVTADPVVAVVKNAHLARDRFYNC